MFILYEVSYHQQAEFAYIAHNNNDNMNVAMISTYIIT